MLYVVIGVVGLVVYVYIMSHFRKITVQDYQRALKFVKGRCVDTLMPGEYRYNPRTTEVKLYDIRPVFASVNGQEVISRDGVSLRVSLATAYRIEEPRLVALTTQNVWDTVYLTLQIAMREAIGNADIDELLANRNGIGVSVLEAAGRELELYGIRLVSANVKDIMFPGPLKSTFSAIVTARKEAEAAMERARGEAAAMRSLANTARMLERTPALMSLRLLSALEESTGNTIVMGLPDAMKLLPVGNSANGE